MSTGLVEELVHQFADPLAFYRELIQNSLDAGSTRIEVTLRYLPGAPGLATAVVADWGEGMTRQTIERFLLTKFRSSKENDLTKIGKFGVGFMSVLAPRPQLVVVDTGRDGEDWRLLLHPDFSYELLRAPEPVEGTRVTLHKEMPPPEYRAFAEGSREAVARWCKHADADITFAAGGDDGAPPGARLLVRAPFTVDAPFQVEHREEGTLIVAGLARQGRARCGFYNRGLTLLESEEELLPGVTFKIQSRYLEHTLTRDNVRRDRHFERAMKLVGSLVDGPLLERLPGELRAAAERGAPDEDLAPMLAYGEGRLGREDLWFPLAAGGAVDGKTLRRAARKEGAVLFAPRDGPLPAALATRGVVVLRQSSELLGVVLAVTGTPGALARDRWVMAVKPDEDDSARALAAEFSRLVRAAGAPVERCLLASVFGAGDERPLARVEELDAPRRVAKGEHLWGPGPPVACLNARHPRVRTARALAARNPVLAALLLAREHAAGAGVLDDARDKAMTEAALS